MIALLACAAWAWAPNYRLVTSFPLAFAVDERAATGMTPEETVAAFDAAMATWNAVSCVPQPIVARSGEVPPGGFVFDGVHSVWFSDDDDSLQDPSLYPASTRSSGSSAKASRGCARRLRGSKTA